MLGKRRARDDSSASAERATVVAAFVEWLKARGASLDGLDIKANEDGESYGVYASRALKSGDAFGRLPKEIILDPLAVLADDPVAVQALKLGGSPAVCFWFALANSSKSPSHEFAPYLASLPRSAPDPCSWSDEERALFDGTQLAVQVARQLRLLADEHAKIQSAAPHVSFKDMLWARGCHLSRCFPRALVEAAALSSPHQILASDMIEESHSVTSLTVEHGGGQAAKVTWSAPPASAASDESHGRPTATAQPPAPPPPPSSSLPPQPPPPPQPQPPPSSSYASASEEHAAGNLGCLLPMFDMTDHKNGHPIGWEAGCGCIRFRCRVAVGAGEPLYNNYGSKGNQELIFTYGFAIPDNPLDAVEGVVVGCAPTDDEALAAERRRLLDEQEIPYSVRTTDGALLIGPFDIRPSPPAPAAARDAEGEDEGEEEASDGLLPAELLFALQVVGMDDPDEGPMLTLDELELLHATLDARRTALLPTERLDARAAAGTKEGFVAAYRDGQRRVLGEALAEVQAMMAGAGGGEEGED